MLIYRYPILRSFKILILKRFKILARRNYHKNISKKELDIFLAKLQVDRNFNG